MQLVVAGDQLIDFRFIVIPKIVAAEGGEKNVFTTSVSQEQGKDFSLLIRHDA